jgi:hypothetical protein
MLLGHERHRACRAALGGNLPAADGDAAGVRLEDAGHQLAEH